MLDKIKTTHNLVTPTQWAKVTNKQLIKYGGKCLIAKFKTIPKALENLEPELNWDPFIERKYPNNHWQKQANIREFMDRIKEHYSIKELADWKKITWEIIEKHSGITLRAIFNSFPQLFRKAYPEITFEATDICLRVPKNYWENTENRKKFIKKLKNENENLKTYGQWKNLKQREFVALGGSAIIAKYKNFEELLNDLSDDVNGLRYYSPVKHWDIHKIRETMDKIGEQLGVKNVKDWENILFTDFLKIPEAKNFFLRYSTFFDLLKDVYPEHSWDEFNRPVLPYGYWKNKENQRKFLDSFAKKYSLHSPEDWSKISRVQFSKEGGGPMFRYYPNFLELLKSNFPEYNWDLNMKPKIQWKTFTSSEILKKIADIYKIDTLEDWYRISKFQLLSIQVYYHLRRYGGLPSLLKREYPDFNWDFTKFSAKNKKSKQRELFVVVCQLFGSNEEILEDYIHPKIERSNNMKIEFDIFVPKWNLAFEYQGEHHFQEIPAFGPVDMYKQRDEEKVKICKEQSINLVLISFNWDGTLEEIINQIKLQTNIKLDELSKNLKKE